MQAVILAAGMGKRLKEFTAHNTKCMVSVNGVTLIERLLRILENKGLSQIVIVIGYEGKRLAQYVRSLNLHTHILFVENPVYYQTNNIYSLSLAKEYLIKDDTLLFESDLIFEELLVDMLLEDPRETLALVDKFESWMDGTCMVLNDDDTIKDFIPGKYLKFSDKSTYYKTVNIYKFHKNFSRNVYIPFLEAYSQAMGNNEYYESVIKLISLLDTKEIKAKRLTGQVWYEIDDIQDLDIAESLFANSAEEHYKRISTRYGGYWRYPKLLDFCYLVNPYYPPSKMMEEIESNFASLVTQYPSGMDVNSLLAAKNFYVKASHIAAGNGAAELIKELLGLISGKIGLIKPTFEEYPNRYHKSEIVYYEPKNEDFRYGAVDLKEFFSRKENRVDTIVLINPDNPSGNYIDQPGLIDLITWCKERGIRLIIDESFVDFADAGESGTAQELTLINDDVLSVYEELYVIKSISKSYGVPGLRLGVLSSSNEEMIARLKDRLSIWNINSFAEFYMQICNKYLKDYDNSLKMIRKARKLLIAELKSIPWLRVIPSQANYLMCEIIDGAKSSTIAYHLLEQNILIKDLTPKINNGRQYIRIAVRKEEDNERLLNSLQSLAITK